MNRNLRYFMCTRTLPEAAQLAYDLADEGLPMPGTPITDEDCCRMIQERWGIHGGN